MRSSFKLGTFLSLCITACMASCGSDEPASTAETCGNGLREGSEQCDGPDLGGKQCKDATGNPASVGTLLCAPNCVFNPSQCSGGGVGGMGGTGP